MKQRRKRLAAGLATGGRAQAWKDGMSGLLDTSGRLARPPGYGAPQPLHAG